MALQACRRMCTEAWEHRELFGMLIQRNIKIRYKSSMLGFFWTLLSPLFLIGIYALFLGILRFQIPLAILVTGIIVWQYLAMCLGDALYAILGNANLVKKTPFPRILLPMSMVTANLVNFLLSLAVVLVYLVLTRSTFTDLYLLPVAVASHAALCAGMAFMISAANVFFRDTEHIQGVVTLAWFFVTPVIYPVSLVTEKFPLWVQQLYFLNPMTGILSLYRHMLVAPTTAPASLLALSLCMAWLFMLAGTWLFQHVEGRFADEL